MGACAADGQVIGGLQQTTSEALGGRHGALLVRADRCHDRAAESSTVQARECGMSTFSETRECVLESRVRLAAEKEGCFQHAAAGVQQKLKMSGQIDVNVRFSDASSTAATVRAARAQGALGLQDAYRL